MFIAQSVHQRLFRKCSLSGIKGRVRRKLGHGIILQLKLVQTPFLTRFSLRPFKTQPNKGKGWFVRQQVGSSWNRSNSIGCSQYFICLQVASEARQNISGLATRSPLNMFFGLFYPLLFEVSALIPDPAFSKG